MEQTKLKQLRIGVLEPFYGGSHRAFALGWQAHSRHAVEIEGMLPRFWKWRMRGAAFEMARRIRERDLRPDVWLVGSLMDVAHFRALAGDRNAPTICYFHESQAAYPWRGDGEPDDRDLQYIFTDLASAAASDAVAFNSATLRDDFLSATRKYVKRMPDARPTWLLDEIEAKSLVLPLGVEVAHIDAARGAHPAEEGQGKVVLWCHRWEYDKNPEEFFQALFRLHGEGVPFRLIVAGGTFGRAPEIFAQAREVLAGRILHWGGVDDPAAYAKLLAQSDVVVSTSFHETFGLAMIEAAYAGAHPLAPRRLSYPEVFPPELHAACLYGDPQGLTERLRGLLTGREQLLERKVLQEAFGKYSWENRVKDFDEAAARVYGKGEV